jgi:plastocyanin
MTSVLSSAVFGENLAHKPIEHIIDIQSFAFVPQLFAKTGQLALKAGDRITWINQDIVPHTATASDGSWDTGLIAAGAQVSLQVSKGWQSSYYCIYHPKMRGELVITDS